MLSASDGNTRVVARMTGSSCTWTATGRWRVAWFTARSIGQRLSFAWCLGWNYTWVVARLIEKNALGLSLTDGDWRVAQITARSIGRKLSFAWCLGRNYT